VNPANTTLGIDDVRDMFFEDLKACGVLDPEGGTRLVPSSHLLSSERWATETSASPGTMGNMRLQTPHIRKKARNLMSVVSGRLFGKEHPLTSPASLENTLRRVAKVPQFSLRELEAKARGIFHSPVSSPLTRHSENHHFGSPGSINTSKQRSSPTLSYESSFGEAPGTPKYPASPYTSMDTRCSSFNGAHLHSRFTEDGLLPSEITRATANFDDGRVSRHSQGTSPSKVVRSPVKRVKTSPGSLQGTPKAGTAKAGTPKGPSVSFNDELETSPPNRTFQKQTEAPKPSFLQHLIRPSPKVAPEPE
ncbi:hypothetical protein CYMTET_8846, partial [Cymbomonas tetramitiformis]